MSSSRKKKILVVEDELGIASICCKSLTPEGYQVDTAGNGAIAETMLRKESYELLIIDVRTPVMNGQQFYQLIKERYPHLTDRVIFTSGDVASNDTQDFLDHSGQPFLLKPFTPDELKGLVRKTLGQKHQPTK